MVEIQLELPSGRYQVRYFHLGRRIAADTTFPTKSDERAPKTESAHRTVVVPTQITHRLSEHLELFRQR